jgi:hypothetical protein
MKRRHTLLGVLPVILFAGCSLLASSANADTNVSGSISTNTTWGGDTYIVQSTVTVNSGATLTIQPGTVVRFTSHQGLTVANSSALVAEGSPTGSITFTASSSSPSSGFWDRIKLDAGASSTIAHATITYAGWDQGAVYNNGGNLTLDTVTSSLTLI